MERRTEAHPYPPPDSPDFWAMVDRQRDETLALRERFAWLRTRQPEPPRRPAR